MGKHRQGRRLTRAERRRQVIRNRIIVAVCFVVALIAIIIGVSLKVKSCNEKKYQESFTYKKSQIYVKKDKSLVLAFVEDFSKDYYDEKELEEQVEAEIDSFNKSAEEGQIQIDKFAVNKKKAYLYLNVDSIDCYEEYYENYMYEGQELEMSVGTMEETEEAGYMLIDHYTNVKNGKAVDKIEFANEKDLMVLYTTQGANFSVDGDILYVSEDVKVKDGVATTVDQEPNFIIYREEK